MKGVVLVNEAERSLTPRIPLGPNISMPIHLKAQNVKNNFQMIQLKFRRVQKF